MWYIYSLLKCKINAYFYYLFCNFNNTQTDFQVVNSLIETGYQHFKKSISYAKQEEESAQNFMTSDLSGANKAHMALVLYCDKFLRQKDDG